MANKFIHITVTDVELTDVELLSMGQEAAQLNANLIELEYKKNKIESEKKTEVDKVKSEILNITADLRDKLKCIKTKKTEKVIKAEEKLNTESKEIEYWYNDAIVKTRPATGDELQLKFDITDEQYPEKNETIIEMPEWLYRGAIVNYQNLDDSVENCTVQDFKVEKNENEEIISLEVKLDKISVYVDYSCLAEIEKDNIEYDA